MDGNHVIEIVNVLDGRIDALWLAVKALFGFVIMLQLLSYYFDNRKISRRLSEIERKISGMNIPDASPPEAPEAQADNTKAADEPARPRKGKPA